MRKRIGRVNRKENDCLLLKALITQNQINNSLFESGGNIISNAIDNEEVRLLLAKSKAYILEARNYVHGRLYPTHACTQCLLILMHVHDYCRSLVGRIPIFF